MHIQDHFNDLPTLREWLNNKKLNDFTWSIDDRDQANCDHYGIEMNHLDFKVAFEVYRGWASEYDSTHSRNRENLKIIINELYGEGNDDLYDLIFCESFGGYQALLIDAGINLEDESNSHIKDAIESILSLEDYPVLSDSIDYCETCDQYMSREDIEFHYTDNKTECDDCYEPIEEDDDDE